MGSARLVRDVLPGVVELRRPLRRHPAGGRVQRHGEIEDHVGPEQRRVCVEHPVEVETPGRVARQAGEEISIGHHRRAAPQRGQDLLLEPIAEIGSLQQAELLRGERSHLFPGLEQRFDERRRFPLGGDDGVALAFEPAGEQLALGRLARAVRPFERDEQAALQFALLEKREHVRGSGFPSSSGLPGGHRSPAGDARRPSIVAQAAPRLRSGRP
jgi:hypothetical protein